MAKLVLHVGPGKCGSSSIQNFFGSGAQCVENVRFRLLDPVLVQQLDCEQPAESTLKHFADLLAGNAKCDVLVLSHEVLFKRPVAVRHICRLAAGSFPRKIIVGYSRRQSQFVVSAYSQWLFRSPERISETTAVLTGLGLDPMLFSGLERQLIASIANDFHSARQLDGASILDWHKGYERLSELLQGLGAEILCGVLPGKESAELLFSDFCAKSELTLREDAKATTRLVANTSFNQDVVEAVDNAIALGFPAPTPHERNQDLHRLSGLTAGAGNEPSAFLDDMKSYVDSYYWHSNQLLCRQFRLTEAYFVPATQSSKAEVLDRIASEGRRRTANNTDVIVRYRTLAARMAELCLKLTEAPPPRTGDVER